MRLACWLLYAITISLGFSFLPWISSKPGLLETSIDCGKVVAEGDLPIISYDLPLTFEVDEYYDKICKAHNHEYPEYYYQRAVKSYASSRTVLRDVSVIENWKKGGNYSAAALPYILSILLYTILYFILYIPMRGCQRTQRKYTVERAFQDIMDSLLVLVPAIVGACIGMIANHVDWYEILIVLPTAIIIVTCASIILFVKSQYLVGAKRQSLVYFVMLMIASSGIGALYAQELLITKYGFIYGKEGLCVNMYIACLAPLCIFTFLFYLNAKTLNLRNSEYICKNDAWVCDFNKYFSSGYAALTVLIINALVSLCSAQGYMDVKGFNVFVFVSITVIVFVYGALSIVRDPLRIYFDNAKREVGSRREAKHDTSSKW